MEIAASGPMRGPELHHRGFRRHDRYWFVDGAEVAIGGLNPALSDCSAAAGNPRRVRVIDIALSTEQGWP